MSSLPTPQSDRRRTLRSYSHAQAAAPIEEEPNSDEGDITQYAEATEETTEEAPEEIMESSASHNAEAHHESEDGTPSPRATRTGARSTGSSMPRMSPDGMISMTFEELMVFCDRMNARRNDNNTPADDFKSTIREYQKDIQKAMDTKAVTTFDGMNYQAWRIGILADAEVIGGTDILTKNQRACPQGFDALDTEKWNIRTKTLYRRMLQSLLGPVRTTIGVLEPDNAAALWETIGLEYAVSLAEERLNITKELATLYVKDNDYLAFQRRYRYLIARHKELGVTVEDIHHDMFLISLRDYQKAFVKMRLDEFFATGQDPISNIDVDDLMKQLTNRTSKRDTDRPRASRANAATTDSNISNNSTNASSNSSMKCNFCDLPGHNRAACWRLHPELATERWREANKDKIVNNNESSVSGRSKKKKKKDKDNDKDKSDDKVSSDVLNAQPSAANSAIALSASSNIMSKPWYLDTCASFNMTGEKHSMIRTKAFADDLRINTADGGQGKVKEIGDILLESEGGDIVIRDVHWIPNLTVNLLSFAKLEDQGFCFELSPSTPSYFIMRSPNGVIFTAVRTPQSNVYKIIERESEVDVHHESRAVNFLAKSYEYGDALATIDSTDHSTDQSTNTTTTVAKTLMEWHVDLGHIHAGAIIALAKNPLSGVRIKGPKTGFFCDSCVKAGMTRKYSQTPMPRALRALERVHIDLAGGGRTLDEMLDHPVESRQGTKYYMLITDDATRYRWVYFLHTKDQAFEIYEHWIKFMLNLGFTPPAYVRTDIDGVFRSAKMTALFTSQGTVWEPTTPHSPHQDGVSERGIRTIMARARAILIGKDIPKKFWADILDTVVAISNNTPTSTILYNAKFWPTNTSDKDPVRSPHTIPFSALTNAPPQVIHYRELGSDVYAHLHGSQKPADKLSARADLYKLIGFRGCSIYRLWSPTSDKLLVTSDVVFPTKKTDDYTNNNNINNNTTTMTADAEAPPATHLVEDSDAPELFEPCVPWMRPAKAFAVFTPSLTADGLPRSFKDAVGRPGGVGEWWRRSMQREITDLERRKTWTLVPRSDVPEDEPVAPGRWVFLEKDRPDDPNADEDGILRKSRWVICGNWLKKSPREETYAPVVTDTTNRMMFAIAAKRGWILRQVDIILAYLHGRLGKTVYMRQPTGFEAGTPRAMVCAVEGSLYGLDPAAKIWYDYLTAILCENGFIPSSHDPGLWRHDTRKNLFMTIYVDDLHIIAEEPVDADWLVDMLGGKLEVKDLKEPKKYLGMEVSRTKDGVKLTLERYITRLAQDFRLDDAVPARTPMEEGLRLDDSPVSEKEGGFTKTRYQHGVGCLQYLAVKLRPDIARAASLLAQKNSAPTPKAWKALLHVIRYLHGSKDLGIFYKGSNDDEGLSGLPNAAYTPIGYTDSDWAGPLNGDRKSTSGFIFKLADAPISWRSAKQPCVSLSSNEAEYVALSEAVREATWLRNLMIEMAFIPADKPIKIFADNKGSIDLATVAAITARSKHIDTRFHFSRTQLKEGVISLEHIPTGDMAADGLTKPLGIVAFKRFIDLLGMTGENGGNV